MKGEKARKGKERREERKEEGEERGKVEGRKMKVKKK